jgi:twitching motility protein PilT
MTTPNTPSTMDIISLLEFGVKNNASDVYLSAGQPPWVRINDEARRVNLPPMSADDAKRMIYDIMSDDQRKIFDECHDVDFAFEKEGLARFRVNAFMQMNGAGAVFRTIPSKVLSLEQLKCPPIFRNISEHRRGLVLVTGPTGSGKSTTLAAMIDYINNTRRGHILTIEDPIEFVHKSNRCIVNQREYLRHTLSFEAALEAALREKPDIILVGELREQETIRLALRAAETGHLVFGTLHTSSASKTINRVVEVFPAAEQEQVRSMLSGSLQAVIAQTLCRTANGNGLVAAHEIMVATPAVRNLIRGNKIAQMDHAIETGRQQGMKTLKQALQTLVEERVIVQPEMDEKLGQLEL